MEKRIGISAGVLSLPTNPPGMMQHKKRVRLDVEPDTLPQDEVRDREYLPPPARRVR